MDVRKDTEIVSLETWEGNIRDFPLDGDRLRITNHQQGRT